jgi:hypothetical protein
MKKRLPFLAEQIKHNSVYKIVALVVASAIWMTTLLGRKDTILVRNMEIEFLTRPGLIAVPVDGRELQIRVAGPRTQLQKFSQMGKMLTVQLRDVNPGMNSVKIEKEDVQLPLGVKLISVKPPVLKVDIKSSN